jgi:hypothetical protein
MSCVEPFAAKPKTPVGAEPSDRIAYFLLPIFFLFYWVVSALVLWRAYSISPSIRGGYYEHHQALVLVTKMGLIITVLTSFAWLLLIRKRQKVWTAIWRTAVVLVGYAAIVLARWTFSSSNAFVGILGSVNGHFFSEFDWLGFVLYVTPVMSGVSGVLYFVHRKIHDQFQRAS